MNKVVFNRYQDLIDHHLSEEINRIIQQLQQSDTNFNNIPILNMLNAKYIMADNNHNPVFTNPNALGNTWFVSQIMPVNSPDEAIVTLNNIDPAQTAVVNVAQFPMEEISFNQEGSIELVEYQPNYLKSTSTPAESFAVFSEVYYSDGWKALLDGEEVDYIRANYILRAMHVPAGSHTIEFVFNPTSYRVGSTLMVISSILLVIDLTGSVGYTGRKLKKAKNS